MTSFKCALELKSTEHLGSIVKCKVLLGVLVDGDDGRGN